MNGASPSDPGSARLLQPDEVCAQLGITKRTLYEMVQRGRIEHIKLSGRLLRFRQEQIDAWVDAQVVAVRQPRVRRQATQPRAIKFSVSSRANRPAS